MMDEQPYRWVPSSGGLWIPSARPLVRVRDPMSSLAIAFMAVLKYVRDQPAEVDQERLFGRVLGESMTTNQALALIKRPSGRIGFCWEYGVHEALKAEVASVTDAVLSAIALLTKTDPSPPVESVVWGTEKGQDSTAAAAEALGGRAELWSPMKGRNPFLDAGRLRQAGSGKQRARLPKGVRGLHAADLFVRPDGERLWFGVSVKWQLGLFHQVRGETPGVYIGLYLEDRGASMGPRFLKRGRLAVAPVPNLHDFGEAFIRANQLWMSATPDRRVSRLSRDAHATSDEHYLMELLLELADQPMAAVIEALQPLTEDTGKFALVNLPGRRRPSRNVIAPIPFLDTELPT